MRTVRVELTGKMPLLMHADNIDWADKIEAWKKDPKNKALSKPGDDRTPAWTWIGCLNHDDPQTGVVTIPSEYLMSCIMAGAAAVPTGKGQKTFKAQSQSGILTDSPHWPLLVNGGVIPMSAITPLLSVDTFTDHVDAIQKLGFSLFVKRAKVNNTKHVRVRPRFDNWSVAGDLIITDRQITDGVLENILDFCGRLKGLGDWRPSSPKSPGQFGTFEARIIS